jgi:hypothetical protein
VEQCTRALPVASVQHRELGGWHALLRAFLYAASAATTSIATSTVSGTVATAATSVTPSATSVTPSKPSPFASTSSPSTSIIAPAEATSVHATSVCASQFCNGLNHCPFWRDRRKP